MAVHSQPAVDDTRRVLFLGFDSWLTVERLPLLLHEAGFAIAAISHAQTMLDLLPWELHMKWRRDATPEAHIDEAIEKFKPQLIVLLDESTLQLMNRLLLENPENFAIRHRTLLQRSFGDLSTFHQRTSRSALAELSTRIKMPESISSTELDALMAFGFAAKWNCVFKIEATAGGTGVLRSENEASFLTHASRLTETNKAFVVQRFVDGRVAMRTVAAIHGKPLCGLSLAKIESNGPYGFSTVVKTLSHDGMEAIAAQVAAAWRISGFFSCDIVIDSTDIAWLVEVNARPTTVLHLGHHAGVDFARATADMVAGHGAVQIEKLQSSRHVALFPKEWLRSSISPWLTSADNDIPWQYPEMIAHYASIIHRQTHQNICTAPAD